MGCNKKDAIKFYKLLNRKANQNEIKSFLSLFCKGCKREEKCNKETDN